MSVYSVLSAVDVNNHTETKNGLTYLSWAWAWAEVKKHFPDASYTIYENKDGLFYHHDGNTAWVKTGVTIEGLEHIEYLPVMDFKNKSIEIDKLTSFDVNKAIQRSLTKAVARHGLGLYIYAGEDLPMDDTKPQETANKVSQPYITNDEIKILEELCKQINWNPEKVFKNWPKLTSAEYTTGCAEIRRRLGGKK